MRSVLNAAGIKWRHESEFYMKATGRPPLYAVEAKIGHEKVWIYQVKAGDGFVFQSQSWWFRNKGNIQELASIQSAEHLLTRVETNRQQQTEEARQTRLTEQRMQEERVRVQREEAERNRLEEEERKQETAGKLVEEQKRQSGLADEAKKLLDQMDVQRSQSAKPAHIITPTLGDYAPTLKPPVEEMERIIGSLHQANALRKIRERLPELKTKFGATLEREEMLEDETIELKLMI